MTKRQKSIRLSYSRGKFLVAGEPLEQTVALRTNSYSSLME